MAMSPCCIPVYNFLFEYDTARIVVIKSRKVGLMNRIVQLAILAYIIGWVFVWEKGYQEFDSVVSSVTIKVKGVAVTNTSDLGRRIWDVADYVIPPQEENSFFVMTNLLVTQNQKQQLCAELPDSRSHCQSDKNCTRGYVSIHSSGVQTGRCIKYNASVKTCEVFAWCPVENDTYLPKPAVLEAAENFTVLIKNNIRYPKFSFIKRNILPTINESYLKTCMFDRNTNLECPIFQLGYIVKEARSSFKDMAVQGGVMGILINWDCDLDQSASKCVPKYTFRRLDNNETHIAPGYNFRFPKYYKDANGTETRTLTKAYGIRFDVLVFGKAGKFDIIPTMINIGSGLALLGLATVVCDIIVLYFFKKKYYYREKKYKYVEEYGLGANTPDDDSAP
uniref:P2X purinoceptor n=1 Tax=Latimeria chalumnae TaxID=7897 RepID=M3XJ04_LATCH|nr:PREDICTED: P2X purinoceptor 4 [Latimeria chalumnae]|eukprot:XP_005989067.1 PREDICTED: P2X purinoceptor 4 [Latimeria chalumnae]